MVCGSLNVWPLPTIKASLSSRSLTFEAMQVKFDVNTKFDDAKKLLQNAYNIFLFDLKSMEEKASAASSGSSSKGAANSDNEQPGDGNKNADPTLPTEAKQTHRNCDINKIVINAEILNAPDVYVHIEVDESYELNVTRKLNILLFVLPWRQMSIAYWFTCAIFFLVIVSSSIENRRQRYIKGSHQSEFIFWRTSWFVNFAAINLVRRRRRCVANFECGPYTRRAQIQVNRYTRVQRKKSKCRLLQVPRTDVGYVTELFLRGNYKTNDSRHVACENESFPLAHHRFPEFSVHVEGVSTTGQIRCLFEQRDLHGRGYKGYCRVRPSPRCSDNPGDRCTSPFRERLELG